MDWSLIISIVILLAVALLLYLWKKSKGKRVEKRLAEVTYERDQWKATAEAVVGKVK